MTVAWCPTGPGARIIFERRVVRFTDVFLHRTAPADSQWHRLRLKSRIWASAPREPPGRHRRFVTDKPFSTIGQTPSISHWYDDAAGLS